MRRHHEEVAAALPALSLLLPFAGALWLRLKAGRKPGPTSAAMATAEGEGET